MTPSYALSRCPAMSLWVSLMRKLLPLVIKSCKLGKGYSRVPPGGRDHGSQMPQTVGIDQPIPRREIQQFKTHGQDDPGHNHARPGCPGLGTLPVSYNTKASPQQVLDDANHHVCHHVVRVVPRPEAQIADMQRVQQDTDRGPQSAQGGTVLGLLQVQTKDSNHSQVEPEQDAGARREVVQLLGQAKVPGMENHTERPAGQSDVPKGHIVFPQRMPFRNCLLYPGHAMPMGRKVEEGEEHGKGLLHAHDPLEGPFAVELDHGAQHRGVARNTAVGNDMLAGVITFGRAGP